MGFCACKTIYCVAAAWPALGWRLMKQHVCMCLGWREVKDVTEAAKFCCPCSTESGGFAGTLPFLAVLATGWCGVCNAQESKAWSPVCMSWSVYIGPNQWPSPESDLIRQQVIE